MASITIYTTPFCPYCIRAKRLLQSKGLNFHEIDVSLDPGQRKIMMEKSHGAYTVPQIFIGDNHIGDCDYIHNLERAGQLDSLLAS